MEIGWQWVVLSGRDVRAPKPTSQCSRLVLDCKAIRYAEKKILLLLIFTLWPETLEGCEQHFLKKKWIRIKWKVWHLMLSSLQTTCLSYLPVCGHGLPSSPLLLLLLVRGPGTCPPGSVYFPLFWSLLPVSTYCSLIQGVFTSPAVCQAPHWVLVLSKCSSLSSLDNCFSEEQRFKSVFSTSHSAWHTERHSKWLRTVVLVFRIILLNKFNWWLGEGHPVLSW